MKKCKLSWRDCSTVYYILENDSYLQLLDMVKQLNHSRQMSITYIHFKKTLKFYINFEYYYIQVADAIGPFRPGLFQQDSPTVKVRTFTK